MPDLIRLLQWDGELATGLPALDREHRRILAHAERLRVAMLEGQDRPLLECLLAALIDYTVTHFRHEADLMAGAGYPELHAHAEEHLRLREKILDFQRRFESGETATSIELLRFLPEWLATHIREWDRGMALFALNLPKSA